MTAEEVERRTRPITGGRVRICTGASHVEGCHHEVYMREGVERFLAHPEVRRALRLALSQERPISPDEQADQVLVYLARVAARV